MRLRIAACVAVACVAMAAGLSAQATTERSRSQRSARGLKTIKITGVVAACYKPDKWIVFVTSLPPSHAETKPRFESQPVILGRDGRFTLLVDPAKATPGEYELNFGRTRKGAGGRRFTLKSEDVDLGILGECDV